ncbi:MAG: hypothetical protein GY851_36250 [bacterium]|nr:hypothetical protein [bacterium]
MSEQERISTFRIYLFVAGVLAIMALAAGLGFLVATPLSSGPGPGVQVTAPGGDALPEPAPLYLYADARPRADMEAVLKEVGYAADAGVHRYVLVLPLTWEEATPEGTLRPLARIAERDPLAEFIIALTLNPPGAWLREHPEAAASDSGLPSVASDAWRQSAKDALARFIKAVRSVPESGRVRGYLLQALKDGRWYHGSEPDDSSANLEAFREWLTTRYETDTAIQAAWADDTATLEKAPIPRPSADAGSTALRASPADQPYVDYARFVSETTAGAIESLAGYVKGEAGEEILVIVPYGHSLEALPTGAGHYALARLLRSSVVDGFVSPVSYYDRGIGGAGGFMGPVHSARLHAKHWFILDDTRTGIARDSESGRIERQAGLQTRDVYKVQRRNFAAALANGIGLFWADPTGVGCLADEEMWRRIDVMQRAYRSVWPDGAPAPTAPLMPSEPPEASGASPAPAAERVPLMAVVDEGSRLYLTDSRSRAHELLVHARDCVLRSGVPSQFCLLSDVLDGTAPPAAVYLLLNAFHLEEQDRDTLIATARRNRAALVWAYAPGYLTTSTQPGQEDGGEAVPPILTASVENVAAATLMPVKAFEEPARAGSAYKLEGVWMNPGDPFGEPVEWDPLFYVEGEELFTLATYRESGKPSVAIEFFEDQWASVFIAEPSLSVNLLREILRILEQHIYLSATSGHFMDTCHFGPDIVAVHASADGDRELDLDVPHDAVDLLELDGALQPVPSWAGKQYPTVPMTMGETRVFQLSTSELPSSVGTLAPLPPAQSPQPR